MRGRGGRPQRGGGGACRAGALRLHCGRLRARELLLRLEVDLHRQVVLQHGVLRLLLQRLGHLLRAEGRGGGRGAAEGQEAAAGSRLREEGGRGGVSRGGGQRVHAEPESRPSRARIEPASSPNRARIEPGLSRLAAGRRAAASSPGVQPGRPPRHLGAEGLGSHGAGPVRFLQFTVRG